MNPKRLAPTSLLALLLGAVLFVAAGCSLNNTQDDIEIHQSGVRAIQVESTPAIAYEDDPISPLVVENADTTAEPSDVESQLCVRFLDVGQGDCTLISCDGKHLLIDGGPSSASSKLYAILDTLNIDRLDYIIVTHPDADHCGGVAGALNRAACGTFYCSVTQHDTKTFQNIVKYLGTTPITVPHVGDSFALGPTRVEFLGPSPGFDGNTNNGSLVCRIDYGTTSFLFTGDAERESEAALILACANLDCDVLKVGHHGSDTSSSVAFLQATKPETAVISVGQNNYGHPAPETLERLAQIGANVMRTDVYGTIIAISDGHDVTFSSTQGSIFE